MLLMSYCYRVQVEERVLRSPLGKLHVEHMHHTRRLIPFVL